MKHFIFILFLVLIIGSGLTSCVKEKNFPIQPAIEFKQYISYNQDSADCIIKFKDGDGDIGVIGTDTTVNLKMKYLWKDTTDGLFKPYDATFADTTFDTLYYSNIIKNITPDGQYKALDGEIKVIPLKYCNLNIIPLNKLVMKFYEPIQ